MVNKVQARHILVKKKTLAEDIIEQINQGARFEEMAKKHSSCSSRKKGGSLGEFGRGKMDKDFEKAVFALQKNQMTQIPVKTQFGYHIIKRTR